MFRVDWFVCLFVWLLDGSCLVVVCLFAVFVWLFLGLLGCSCVCLFVPAFVCVFVCLFFVCFFVCLFDRACVCLFVCV